MVLRHRSALMNILTDNSQQFGACKMALKRPNPSPIKCLSNSSHLLLKRRCFEGSINLQNSDFDDNSAAVSNRGAFDLMRQLLKPTEDDEVISVGDDSVEGAVDPAPLSARSSESLGPSEMPPDDLEEDGDPKEACVVEPGEDLVVEEFETISVDVEVHETYQFGLRRQVVTKSGLSKCIIHFPECVEPIEVTYPITCDLGSDGVPNVPVNYPPIYLGEDHKDELKRIIDQSFGQICRPVNQFYQREEERKQASVIQEHVDCNHQAITLRKQLFRLLLRILPDLEVAETFDCSTSDLDRLLDYICIALRDSDTSSSSSPGDKLLLRPVVSLCNNPKACLHRLKGKIFETLTLILPQLQVPESFTVESDLPHLIDNMYVCS